MVGWHKIFESISKMQIKSITDSLFRLTMIIFLFALIAGIFKAESWLTISFLSIGFLVLIFSLFHYNYHSKRNPDYLRSEPYQQNKQIIDLLGDKDNSLNPNMKDLKYIASPFSKQIEDKPHHDLGEHS
jgi:energy-coupling factor transporter transmembrane protein EcfT